MNPPLIQSNLFKRLHFKQIMPRDYYKLIETPLGTFSLQQKLGGKGDNWLGKNQDDKTHYVVFKFDTGSSQFNREAVALTCLGQSGNHPNITTPLGEYSDSDGNYLMLAHIPGRSLNRIKTNQNPQSLRVLLPVLDALDHCARSGVVHNDLKPENLVVQLSGSRYQSAHVVVVDFGSSEHVTQPPSLIIYGSPIYIAPERFNLNNKPHIRSDLFSVGSIGCKLLTGMGPYAQTTTEVFRCVDDLIMMRAKQIDPRTINRRISPRLNAVLRKSVTVDPDKRFQEPRELKAALEDVLTDRSWFSLSLRRNC